MICLREGAGVTRNDREWGYHRGVCGVSPSGQVHLWAWLGALAGRPMPETVRSWHHERSRSVWERAEHLCRWMPAQDRVSPVPLLPQRGA